MNRTTLGIAALIFSFLCMGVMGYTRTNAPASENLMPTPVPRRTNPSDPTPKKSPYKNPSDPKPTRSPYKNPSDPKPTASPYKNPSDPKPTASPYVNPSDPKRTP
jgi:hypothetical protein